MTDADKALLRRMISESGKMWLEVRDRSFKSGNSVIICADPEHAFYLERAENYNPRPQDFFDGWVVLEQSLRMADAEGFFAAFGSQWPVRIGAIVKTQPVRAYIKNGRHEDWSFSLGPSE